MSEEIKLDNFTIVWQCSCGQEFDQKIEKHEGCLPFLINGKSPTYYIRGAIQTTYPLEYIQVSYNLDLE